MANNRKAIRAALKTMLLGNTAVGANVFTNRETLQWQTELPSINIRSGQEPLQPRTITNVQYIRTYELLVDIKVSANHSVDDTLDDISAQIETIIAADLSLAGTVLSCVQKNTDIKLDVQSESEIGVATVTLECTYVS